MNIFSILIVAIIAMIAVNLLRCISKQYDNWVILSVSVLIFGFIVTQLNSIFSFVSSFRSYLPQGSEHFSLLGKMIGVGFLGEFVSSLCMDYGMKSVAGNVEVACKCSMLVMAIPLFEEILKIVRDLMA